LRKSQYLFINSFLFHDPRKGPSCGILTTPNELYFNTGCYGDWIRASLLLAAFPHIIVIYFVYLFECLILSNKQIMHFSKSFEKDFIVLKLCSAFSFYSGRFQRVWFTLIKGQVIAHRKRVTVIFCVKQKMSLLRVVVTALCVNGV